jgi:hypothetical protein
VIAGCDSTKYANVSGLTGLSVVVGEVEGVVGEAEVGLETTTDRTIGRGIMAGAAEEVPSV